MPDPTEHAPTERVRAGTRLVGRRTPDHPDEPINFAYQRPSGMWWYGHECRNHGGPRCACSWATGTSWDGFVLALVKVAD